MGTISFSVGHINIDVYLHCSKLDETSEEKRLSFLLPQHEYFHQYFVLADCENKLFRESSRGLEGGSFYCASVLNRKDAKLKRGKDAIEEMKEYYLLKAEATFCHLFIDYIIANCLA